MNWLLTQFSRKRHQPGDTLPEVCQALQTASWSWTHSPSSGHQTWGHSQPLTQRTITCNKSHLSTALARVKCSLSDQVSIAVCFSFSLCCTPDMVTTLLFIWNNQKYADGVQQQPLGYGMSLFYIFYSRDNPVVRNEAQNYRLSLRYSMPLHLHAYSATSLSQYRIPFYQELRTVDPLSSGHLKSNNYFTLWQYSGQNWITTRYENTFYWLY